MNAGWKSLTLGTILVIIGGAGILQEKSKIEKVPEGAHRSYVIENRLTELDETTNNEIRVINPELWYSLPFLLSDRVGPATPEILVLGEREELKAEYDSLLNIQEIRQGRQTIYESSRGLRGSTLILKIGAIPLVIGIAYATHRGIRKLVYN